ncbi:hypothetical protein HBH98_071140 [Parastagonospora nodorum]|nr:hypothetical protein HBH52_115200 [Parastagonospora nodorum]KAH4000033.1 hypothetical protein HBI10_106510 [Parastagonospora nodorum]KAH4009947.1 hypothetical protein HBI13_212150 [Parastagonospora nodorum]KAH4051232.1 hypothetical protein HBH49_114740 [Parastagonospora nodorum]KAH4091122.1 hypothetical protein HBH46_188550 [Parastagonospora nodorum]
MSTSTQSSVATDVDSNGDNELPKIEALFLIRFDKKVGYTIAWKRTTTDIELENAVEYKSLPSGLHGQASDLVYFTHEGYAGLSAFARGEAGSEERNANFVSVGVLARRDGILGRTWGVAGRLESIARTIAEDEGVAPLEEFWEEQTAHARQHDNTKGHSRARAISTVSAVTKDDERLPAYHPALSMLKYLDVLGPLVFRLQQAALLRKRILFVGGPPVRAMCEFVYILSILSSLSARDSELLLPGAEALLRLPSLFSVGVHDIPSLEAPTTSGWTACTTDEIISTKAKLYDVIVELPTQQRRWPRLRTSSGTLIKASQRDVARYKMLHKELFKHRNASVERYTDDDNDDQQPLISRASIDAHRADDEYNDSYDDSMVEPITWSRLAYSGFMWWASAGEKDINSTSERDADREILGDLSHVNIETSIIAYFHRQTSSLVATLSAIIEESAEEEGYEGEDEVSVGRREVSRLGLDAWSEADRAFLNEFGEMYMGRRVEVRGDEVDCCGLRVPLL